MSTPKWSNDPTHGRSRSSKSATVGNGHSQPALPNPSPHSPADNNSRALVDALEWLCGQPNGWLRVIPVVDENAVWMKWKFTSSRWPNHYVMVKGQTWQLPFIAQELKRKVSEVFAGERVPTLDRPYTDA